MSVGADTARPSADPAALRLPAVDMPPPRVHQSVEVAEPPPAGHPPVDADWSALSLIAAVVAMAVWRMLRGGR